MSVKQLVDVSTHPAFIGRSSSVFQTPSPNQRNSSSPSLFVYRKRSPKTKSSSSPNHGVPTAPRRRSSSRRSIPATPLLSSSAFLKPYHRLDLFYVLEEEIILTWGSFLLNRLDEREDGADIQAYLKDKTGQNTVPNVFIRKYLFVLYLSFLPFRPVKC